jgi:methylated-DNA-[protein]-cysteine S-methyltransferase
MTQEYKAYCQSEIGLIEVVGTEKIIKTVEFIDDEVETLSKHLPPTDLPPIIAACLTQLEEYFQGDRQEFSLTLAPEGTDFQQAVWRQLETIPYGQTVSYLEVARQVGNKKAVRAVGAANGQNPIAIIVPCHRVIGSNGQLTGYGGGLWRKAWLLNHEKRFSSPQMVLF